MAYGRCCRVPRLKRRLDLAQLVRLAGALAGLDYVPILELLSRPRRSSQKREAGFDGGVEQETTDLNFGSESRPAMAFHHLSEHSFER